MENLVRAFYIFLAASAEKRAAKKQLCDQLWAENIRTSDALIRWAAENGRDGKKIISREWPHTKGGRPLGPRSAMKSANAEIAALGKALYEIEHALIDRTQAAKKVLERDIPITPTPEAATPEAATPEAATPEAATPEAATPEAATPEAALNDDSAVISGMIDGIDYACEVFADAQCKDIAWARRIMRAALEEKKEILKALENLWTKKDASAKKAA